MQRLRAAFVNIVRTRRNVTNESTLLSYRWVSIFRAVHRLPVSNLKKFITSFEP